MREELVRGESILTGLHAEQLHAQRVVAGDVAAPGVGPAQRVLGEDERAAIGDGDGRRDSGVGGFSGEAVNDRRAGQRRQRLVADQAACADRDVKRPTRLDAATELTA